MVRLALAAVGLLLATCPTSAHAQPQVDPNHTYGADPGWERFRAIGEAAVIARLIDPESARISWTSGYRKGGYKPLLQPRIHGYVACGLVNARNRMGGYSGATGFVVVIDFDRALFVDMDRQSGGSYGSACAKEIAAGRFPPVPRDDVVTATGSATSSDDDRAGGFGGAPAHGLTVRAMPEGAYISAVEPGSVAATAGLSPGMVITSVNAIPLAGMGDAMTKVIAAAESGAKLELVGGKAVLLGVAR